MKYLFPLLFLGPFLSLIYTSNTTSTLPAISYQEETPAQKTQSYLQEQLQILQNQLDEINQHIEQQDLGKAQKSYLNSRVYFKKIEFLIAYLDPQLYEKFINESPLLKPEPKVANKETHYPKGFQVIDELLFMENDLDYPQIKQLVVHLKQNLNAFAQQVNNTRIYDAVIIHAIKEQLIRSFTLGITGFDTPGSGVAVEDLKHSNQGILEVLALYANHFPNTKIDNITAILKKIPYGSFDEFDRYQYLVEYCIPILEEVENIRLEKYIESKEELNRQSLPVNSRFTNPFQKDFLNPSFYTQINNDEVTKERIALGKVLFNDPLLSKNLQTSCATCHNEKHAFTDLLPKSQNGDKSHTTKRNSPSLNYSIYANAYFYDLRAHDLRNQFDHVIHDAKEFNSSYPEIIEKLNQKEAYTKTFAQNYPQHSNAINTATINHALKCYLMSLPTFDSPFDQLVQNKTKDIPTEIRQGFNLFMGKAQCATCHFPPTFSGLVPPMYTDTESEVLGVLVDENFEHPVLDTDEGRMKSGVVKDNFDFFQHSFKTVSIRNASLTAPYMHNGSISSLEKLIEFYNEGGGNGMGLKLSHQTLPEDKLDLTEVEKKVLIAFIESLTDTAY